MPAGPTMGSPLESPENPAAPGVARPSQLLDSDAAREPSSRGEVGDPSQQLTQVISRVRKIETDIDQLALSYPGAAPHLRKVKDSLRSALKQIVATSGGPGQETPSPRMLG